MGIEKEAVVLYIALIVAAAVLYALLGLYALRKQEKKQKLLFAGSVVSVILAFFFLFNCYFQIEGTLGVSNMTVGIGLFILCWIVSLYCTLQLIYALITPSSKP